MLCTPTSFAQLCLLRKRQGILFSLLVHRNPTFLDLQKPNYVPKPELNVQAAPLIIAATFEPRRLHRCEALPGLRGGVGKLPVESLLIPSASSVQHSHDLLSLLNKSLISLDSAEWTEMLETGVCWCYTSPILLSITGS